MTRRAGLAGLGALVAALWLALTPRAAAQERGFTLNRYEPTHPGEHSFLVDHPWYSASRFFAVGLTLNYAHAPLVFGVSTIDQDFQRATAVIAHQLLGHLDLAGSVFDRVTVGLSLPVTLVEQGRALAGVTPAGSGYLGDPRLSLLVRVFGQPDSSRFSLSLGGAAWLPLRAFTDRLPPQTSDAAARFLVKAVFAGRVFGRVSYGGTLAFLYRPQAQLGDAPDPRGSMTGSELQLGAAARYTGKLAGSPYSVGPELLVASDVSGGRAFERDGSRIELLLGGHYHLDDRVLFGVALGPGFLRAPGSPDLRFLLRVAYAPRREPKVSPVRCLPDEADRDHDGVLDRADLCPTVPMGERPDPERRGCPLGDQDGDGVSDREDTCPRVAAGKSPDAQRPGCPALDTDQDGVLDREDLCPREAAGERPDARRPGCPALDSDKDGVPDGVDQCPLIAASLSPDPQRPGCPLPDRDDDSVPDVSDACPDVAGAPHPDPKKNGCPGMVGVKGGQLLIVQPVYFATDEDVILAQSFPVLQSVADALVAKPEIRRLAVEGHTDDRGTSEHNQDLSDRRARSVRRFLEEHGVAAERLESRGFGTSKPLADNASAEGRASNRRVEFIIKDPPQPEDARARPALTPPPVVIDEAPRKRARERRRTRGAERREGVKKHNGT